MVKLNHAQFNFLAGLLLQILKKFSYDNQQEDILIKPPLNWVSSLKRFTSYTQAKIWKVEREPWTFGLTALYSTTWAKLTMMCERNCWIFKLGK